MSPQTRSLAAIVSTIIGVITIVLVVGALTGRHASNSRRGAPATSSTAVPPVTPAFVSEVSKQMQIQMVMATDTNTAVSQEAAVKAALADKPWPSTVTNASLVTAEDPTVINGKTSLYWLLDVSPSVPVYRAGGPAPVLSTAGPSETPSAIAANVFAAMVDATTGEVVTWLSGNDPSYTP